MTPLTAVQVGAGWFAENPGGLDRYFHDLIEALPEVGVKCRGLVVGTAAVEQETDGAVRAFAMPDESRLRQWRNVRREVSRIWRSTPDEAKLLVTHFATYAYPLIKDSDLRPWVVHFHGSWAEEAINDGGGIFAGWIKRRVERSVYRHADQVIVLSETFRSQLCTTYGINSDRVVVIPGGVDVDRFAAAAATPRVEARRQFGWPTDRPIVLAVRRLVPQMGLTLLVDAMKQVRAAVPNALCIVIGQGPLAGELVQKIDAAGLTDTILPVGFVPDEDLPLAYRAADLAVVPSEASEAFNYSVAESLAAGTPIVVTPVGSLPESVRRLDEKLVVPAADAASLAATISRGLAEPNSLPSPEACRDYASRTFNWPIIAAQVAAVYAAAVQSKSR